MTSFSTNLDLLQRWLDFLNNKNKWKTWMVSPTRWLGWNISPPKPD
jgi:hypothetical protein